MKTKRFYSLIVAMLLMIIGIQAQESNKLYIPDVSVSGGKEFQLPVHVQNMSPDITALQFTIKIPQGIDASKWSSAIVTERLNNHKVSTHSVGDSIWTVMVYSSNNAHFKGDSGAVLYLPTTVADSIKEGSTLTMEMTRAVLSDSLGKNVITNYECGQITIANSPDFIVTDINCDVAVINPEDSINIQWIIKNDGSATTTGGWSEKVFLVSEDGGEVLLSKTENDVILESGTSVSRTIGFRFNRQIGLDGMSHIRIDLIPNADSGEREINYWNNSGKSAIGSITINKKLYLNLPTTYYEESHKDSIECSIIRSGNVNEQLEVTITKEGDDRLFLPEQILIPAGSSTVLFKIAILDNYTIDKDPVFTISISASGYSETSEKIYIVDNDVIGPDLHIVELQNSEPSAGSTMTVTWKVRNDGHLSTGDKEWKDRVWLVPDIQGGTTMRNTLLLATVDNISSLEPGESYENTVNVELPERIYGNYDLVVASDMEDVYDIDFYATGGTPPYPYEPETAEYGFLKGHSPSATDVVEEEGEIKGFSDNFNYKRIIIAVPPLPDLAVTKVVAVIDNSDSSTPSPLSMAGLASSSAFYSGKQIQVTATIENRGGADLEKTAFNNKVFISHSEDYEGDDLVELCAKSTELGLTVNGSSTIIFNFQLPYEWSGDTWFHVQTNCDDTVYEFASITNNWGHSSMINVLLTPGADFEVSNLQVPNVISAGLPLDISYSVNNIGPGVPYVNEWTDKIYLSAKADGLDDSATLIGKDTRSGSFSTDASGKTTYRGDNYNTTCTVNIPKVSAGIYYLYVIADADDDVFEYEGEDNNILVSQAIQCNVPDLTVELINISEENLVLGGSTLVTLKLKNVGEADVQNARIANTFYAKTSLDSRDSIYIDHITDSISLAKGKEIELKGIVSIPNDSRLLGQKSIFVMSNEDKNVAEDNFSNNRSNTIDKLFEPSANLTFVDIEYPDSVVPGEQFTIRFNLKNNSDLTINGDATIDISVKNFDSDESTVCPVTGSLPSVDGLKPGDFVSVQLSVTIPQDCWGGKNMLTLTANPDVMVGDGSKPAKKDIKIFINGNMPDLQIVVDSIPSEISTSTLTEIKWSLKNDGEWKANESEYWICLSDCDKIVDTTTLLLKSNTPELAAGQSVPFTNNIIIDDTHQGPLYIIIHVTSVESESVVSNNTVAIPFVSKQSDLPNLLLSDIYLEGRLRNGETASVSSVVSNIGIGATRKDRWADTYYLSADSIFDADKATILGSKAHVGILKNGESYNAKASLKIPVDAHGYYYLFGVADATNANYETNKEDNIAYIKVYVEDKTDTPVQLTVSDFSSPTKIEAGKSFSLSYTIANESAYEASGTLRDVLYISKDNKWDANDTMVGVVSGEVEIEAGGKTTRQVTGRISNITEGSYYLIVKTNSIRNIFETDYDDNFGVTSQPINITFSDIQMGGTASISTSGYYKLSVSADNKDKTLGFYLSHNQDDPCGLYIAYERVPSTANYDWGSTEMLTGEQEVLVPDMKEGNYYILAQANAAVDMNLNTFTIDSEEDLPEVGMSLNVRDIPFGATSMSIKEGGVDGWLSTEIRGALLDSIMDFRLMKDANTIPVEMLSFNNQTSTYATFNLHDAKIGSYDLISELPNGTQAVLPDGFKVVPGLSVNLGVKLELPGAARSYFFAPISIAYANGGNTDIAIKELLVLADKGVLAHTVDGLSKGETEIHVVPNFPVDRRGYISIPPGTHDVINCFIGTSGDCTVTVYIVK